MSITSESI